jgi:hypothetical protein
MYKEEIQKRILTKYMSEKIDVKRLFKLIKGLESLSEANAASILSKVKGGGSKALSLGKEAGAKVAGKGKTLINKLTLNDKINKCKRIITGIESGKFKRAGKTKDELLKQFHGKLKKLRAMQIGRGVGVAGLGIGAGIGAKKLMNKKK